MNNSTHFSSNQLAGHFSLRKALTTVVLLVLLCHQTSFAQNARGGFSPGGGFPYWGDTQLNNSLADMASRNVMYVRLDFHWGNVEPSAPVNGVHTYNWTNLDRVVDAIHAHGLRVLALPTYTPGWANGNQDEKFPPTTANVANWNSFIRAAGNRYISRGPGVLVWEMWNEPNITNFWKPSANTADYVNRILIPGSNAIRAAASAQGKTVTVITGGLSPATTGGGNIAPIDFVTGIYANGGKNYLDAIGHHPYGGITGPNEPAGWNAFQQTLNLRTIMVNNGDSGKKIWGTETGYPTGTCNGWGGGGTVTEAMQADYVTQSYQTWNNWNFTGALLWYNYQDESNGPNCIDHYGLRKFDGTYKPGWATLLTAMQGNITPLVRLALNENTGTSIANSGNGGGSFSKTATTPAWSTNVPGGVGGASSVNFGTTTGNFVVESAAVLPSLQGLASFTITLWVNCKSSTVGPGGNRLVSWINNGADGADLVYNSNGSITLSVDQWPDGLTGSSINKVTTNAAAPSTNWVFVAVTYSGTQVQYYFGNAATAASPDVTRAYNRGAVGPTVGRLAVGHFNSATRSVALDRMFRGLIDDVRIYGSVLNSTQINQVRTGASVTRIGSELAEVETVDNIDLYPNPVTNGLLTLKLSAGGPTRVNLSNSLGQSLQTLSKDVEGNELTISVAGLPKGLYLTTVIQGQKRQVKKFIIP